MLESEIDNCMALLAGYFPNGFGGITPDEASLWRRKFAGVDYDHARTAIESYKLDAQFDRVTFPAIFGRIKAMLHADAPAQRETAKSPTLATMIRQSEERARGIGSDYEVIVRRHRNLWHRAMKAIEGAKKEDRPEVEAGHRRAITHNCTADLCGAGMVQPKGDGWSTEWAEYFARAVTDDEFNWQEALGQIDRAPRLAGSYIPDRPPHIEVSLKAFVPVVKQPYEAIKELAEAERREVA